MSEFPLSQLITAEESSKRYLRSESRVYPKGSKVSAYESLTVADTAVAFAYSGTLPLATITCEVAQVRFRIDGTNPTATEGHVLNPGDTLKLDSNEDIKAFRVIRTGVTSGILKISVSEVA